METDNQDGMLETRLARVRGQVQGIGWEACVRSAEALGVTGWVRSRMDGSVEAMGAARRYVRLAQRGDVCSACRRT